MERNDSTKDNRKLVEIVYEGLVKRHHGNFVTIELDTPQGIEDINIEECVDKRLPEYGRAVRYTCFIEYAPDLESEYHPSEEIQDKGPKSDGKIISPLERKGIYDLD